MVNPRLVNMSLRRPLRSAGVPRAEERHLVSVKWTWAFQNPGGHDAALSRDHLTVLRHGGRRAHCDNPTIPNDDGALLER